MSHAESSWGLRRGLRLLWSHKKKAFTVFACVMAAAVALVIVLPRKYQSEARLMVRLGRASMTLDPTVTTGQVASVQESRENELNSAVDVLQSRMLQERVAKQVGPSTIVGDQETQSSFSPSYWLKKLGWSDPLDPLESAVLQLHDDVQVRRGKDSSVINLTYEADAPRTAQRIVQAYVDLFLEEHVRINRTPGSYQFFVDQQGKLAKEWEQAAAELRDAKNKLGLVTIEGQREQLQRQIGEAESGLLTAAAEQASLQAAIKSQEAIIDQLPERIRTDEVSGLPNLAADDMRTKLYELEIKHLDLLARYTPDHPQVVAIQDQLADAREIMAQQDRQRSQTTNTVDANRRTLEFQLLANRSQGEAISAKVAALNQQLADLQRRRAALNEGEVLIAELKRRVEVAEITYRDYVADTEQARIDQELEADRISNVSVVQNASLAGQPVKPRKLLILSLGCLIAVFAACGVVLVCESLRPSLLTAEEVEDELNLPVLAALS